MNKLSSTKRSTCPTCLRASSACICSCVAPLPTLTNITIIQHPHEQKHTKGTGRLLHLCLPKSQLLVEERLSQDMQKNLQQEQQAVLLYPATEEDVTIAPSMLVPEDTQLIVLDATWRKSRKMLHLNPMLAALPRLALPTPLPESQYSIRKAEKAQQLATIEAAALALEQIEPATKAWTHFQGVFKQFITQLQGQEAHFKRNTLE